MVFVVKDKKTETKFKEEKPIKFNKDVEYQLHSGKLIFNNKTESKMW